jgi:hypothetical protein
MPAISGSEKAICGYFEHLVAGQQPTKIPESLQEAFEGLEFWDGQGRPPSDNEMLGLLRSKTLAEIHYLNIRIAYFMNPVIAKHVLEMKKYQELDEEERAFLQQVANDLSVDAQC